MNINQKQLSDLTYVVDDVFYHNKFKLVFELVMGKATPNQIKEAVALDRRFQPRWSEQQSKHFYMKINNDMLGTFNNELDLHIISIRHVKRHPYEKKEIVNLAELINFSNSTELRRVLAQPVYTSDIVIYRLEELLDDTQIFAIVGEILTGYSLILFSVKNYEAPSLHEFNFNVYHDSLMEKKVENEYSELINKHYGFDAVFGK